MPATVTAEKIAESSRSEKICRSESWNFITAPPLTYEVKTDRFLTPTRTVAAARASGAVE
jgi:hypothetical protein